MHTIKNEAPCLTKEIHKYQQNVWEVFPSAQIQYFNDGFPRIISSEKDISAYAEFGVQMMGTPNNETEAWKQASAYSDFIRAYNKITDADNRLKEEFIRS